MTTTTNYERLETSVSGIGQPYLNQALLASPPRAPDSFIFLLPALVRVGQSREGDGWANWESTTLYHPSRPPPWQTVGTILAQHRPPQRRPPTSIANNRSLGASPDLARTFSEEMAVWDAAAPQRLAEAERQVAEAQQAHELNEELHRSHAPGVRALHRAFDALALAIINARVAAFGKLRTGELPFGLKPGVFAEDGLSCRVIREGLLTVGDAQAYVFLDKDQLERTFPLEPTVQAPAGIVPSELSTYLQLALHVHALGFGPSFKGEKKEIRLALVKAAGRFSIKLTERQEEYLATFLRNREAQGGKNRSA